MVRRSIIALALVAGIAAHADVFFVPDATSGSVFRVNSTGVKTVVMTPGVGTPEQAVFDADGDLFVSDSANNRVVEYLAVGGSVTFTLAGASGLAFDANGVLYAASSSAGTISKLVNGTFTTFSNLLAGATPRGIAFNPNTGELLVADNGTTDRILSVSTSGIATVFSSDVIDPFAVAFDAAGNEHATDAGEGGRIVKFIGNHQSKADFKNLGTVRGLAYDRAGVAHYLRTDNGGELRKATDAMPLATGLGSPRLLTVRFPLTKIVAFKGTTLAAENNAVLATLGSPAIGGKATAFKGTLLSGVAGVGTSNAAGMWRADSGGAITRLVRKSFAPPGLPNDVVASFGDPVLNRTGSVAFVATMRAGFGTTTTANATALFTDTPGTLGPVLRKGDLVQTAGIDPAVKFTAFKQIVLSDDAGPAVLATIAGPGITTANNLGLWSASANGSFALVVRKGDMIVFADKTRKLASFDLFKASPLSLGQGRHVAQGREFTFSAKFTDGFSAILRGSTAGTPVVLAEKNGSADPAIAGGKFSGFLSPCVSSAAGRFSFVGKLIPNIGGVTTASAGAIINQDAATNHLVAQKTFAATDPAGAFYATLSDTVINPAGATAFLGKMKVGVGGVLTSTAGAIWMNSGTGTASDVAVRQGDPAAGVSGSVAFTAFKQFVLPDTGGPVFTATIAGSGITTANNLGLWACDGAGGVELLLRKGDKVKIDGQTKTVTSFTIFKTVLGATGQRRHFDSDGTVACLLKCSDGTQAIFSFSRP